MVVLRLQHGTLAIGIAADIGTVLQRDWARSLGVNRMADL